MEEGSLRCDANVSLRPAGSSELGTKTELKNMNSFRFLERGISAEIARQREILAGGGQVEQETLHFDPATGALTSLRSKEEAHDYRYFPEPDLVPVAIDEQMLEGRARGDAGAAGRARGALRARARAERRERPAARLPRPSWPTTSRRRSPPRSIPRRRAGARQLDRPASSLGAARQDGEDPARLARRAAPAALAALVGLVVGQADQRRRRPAGARPAGAEGGDPAAIVEAEGLAAIGGADELAAIVAAALAANPDAAEQVRAGNAKAIGPIVGHVMRETKGRADGGEVTRLVHEQLGI